MCVVDYVRISKRLSDNIRKAKRIVSVKISSNEASLFHFLWKTYSLVSDDLCNFSATKVFVRTAESLIYHFHC